MIKDKIEKIGYVERIVERWKKEVMSEICIDLCDKVCCSFNFDINENQASLIYGRDYDISNLLRSKTNHIKDIGFSEVRGPQYRTQFKEGKEFCHQLKEGLCGIYDNPLKSEACRKFPFGIDHKKKVLTYNPKCSATKFYVPADLFSDVSSLGYSVMSTDGNKVDIKKMRAGVRF